MAALVAVGLAMMLGHASADVESIPALAFSPSVGWSSVDSGGCTASGGVFTIEGTAGQPDPELAAGGDLGLSGGFWAIDAFPQADPLIFEDDFETGDLTAWSASAP